MKKLTKTEELFKNEVNMLYTATITECDHKTGWYRTVRLKWWIIVLKRRFFVCKECCNLIPDGKVKFDID